MVVDKYLPAYLFHLMIPPFPDSGICLIDLLVAWAVFVVVVDDPAGLQVGVDRHRAHILEAALLQVFTDLVREAITDRDRSDVMP